MSQKSLGKGILCANREHNSEKQSDFPHRAWEGLGSGITSHQGCTSVASSQTPPPMPFPISLSSMCSQGYIPFPSLQETGILLCLELRGSRCGETRQSWEKRC